MEAEVLFVGMPVRDFPKARAWYELFFARPADVVAHDTEVLWRVTDGAWLYIVRDPDHAGHGIAAVAVADIEEATTQLAGRGIATGPIQREGDSARKTITQDPDGNTLSIIEVRGG